MGTFPTGETEAQPQAPCRDRTSKDAIDSPRAVGVKAGPGYGGVSVSGGRRCSGQQDETSTGTTELFRVLLEQSVKFLKL